MRMTREELKRENKESDGNPEVRSKIRQLQQEMAKRRMMSDVPKADVVITNPTHFAVALRYDDKKMRAPAVVAKGADLSAAQLRAIAAEPGVVTDEPATQAERRGRTRRVRTVRYRWSTD